MKSIMYHRKKFKQRVNHAPFGEPSGSPTFETDCQSCQTKRPLLDWQISTILPGEAPVAWSNTACHSMPLALFRRCLICYVWDQLPILPDETSIALLTDAPPVILDQLLHATACVWHHLAFLCKIRKPFLTLLEGKLYTCSRLRPSSGPRLSPCQRINGEKLTKKFKPKRRSGDVSRE